MKLKNRISKLWVKHIRLRFARFYQCDDCDKRYRLNRTECPRCDTRPYCPFVDAVTASITPDSGGCESDTIKTNGECWDCGYRQSLYFQPIAFSILHKQAKWFIRDHFELNKHDQWIGHYYKTKRGNFDDTGDPYTMIKHYICIIPCLVFKFERWS